MGAVYIRIIKQGRMKKTILVVDDFTSIRKFVCEMLEKKGYNTLGAGNGNEAFNILVQQGENVNLVLTDYNMPDCTGYELLKRIKRTPTVSNVPVIFLTTELNAEKMKSAKDAGLSAWIKKPYKSDSFFSQIEITINSASV
jgi:two-component system chemotaxis response regulator CheY